MLAAEVDVVSLHTPLNAETRGMIDATVLRRGETRADARSTRRAAPSSTSTPLLAALDAGILAGAALDVLPVEPVPARFAAPRPIRA